MRPTQAGPHADRVLRLVGREAAAAGADAQPSSAGREIAAPPVFGAPAVDVSWRRCLNEFKLDPAREYQPTVLDQSRLKSLQAEHDELVQIARAEMDLLYEQISGSGYALLLADTAGVILCEKIDPVERSMFVTAGLIVGAEWSEQREGTNGIGTCAAEARPVTIHQADHFRARHIGLSCSAAPIHDPFGRVVAVLDASCVNATGSRESQLHTVALVNTSARLIEKALFLRRHRTDSLLRFHHRPEFVDLLHDGAIAVADDGTIVAADMTGLKLLGARDRTELVGRSIADVFDATYEELLASASSGRRAIWQLRDNLQGRRYFASLIRAGRHDALPASAAAAPRAIVRVAPCDAPGAMTLEDLAGEDPTMIRNLQHARRIADRCLPVVIRGPTGSGKEAFAKALHLTGVRAKQPFVAVNCAAIPESLIESELFGYCPGAFTGARREGMRGRIAQASGGTLFLDEIGDMPLHMQTRLLRVLEEQEVTPLGGALPFKVDVRVVCASHRNLRDLLQRGEFREDLYYRLNGVTIELPALALRRDKELLIRQCIARESHGAPAAIETAALHRLLAYRWPGNIRELRNTIRAALALCDGAVIRVGDLPADIRLVAAEACGNRPHISRLPGPGAAAAAVPARPGRVFDSPDRDGLLRVIEQHGWVMSRVACHFGISRNTLYRKIKQFGIGLARPANAGAGGRERLKR